MQTSRESFIAPRLINITLTDIHLALPLPVHPQKAHKIDPNSDYPCPCRRRGRLVPIALTDAFGCNRCQQIFVVQENGYVIEQLSTNYPYKRAWRWTGHQWVMVHPSLSRGYLPLTLVILIGLVFLLLLTTLQSPIGSSLTFRVIAALVLSILLVFMLWLACRR
jgi:hypothetical protein